MNSKVAMAHTAWHRNGFRYQFIIEYEAPLTRGKITVSYDWITYKLVKWIHGMDGLNRQIQDRMRELKKELEA